MLRYDPLIKRTLDVLLSFKALLFLSAPFALMCLLICLESEGSPFFFQRRVGKGMVPFRLIKFRTMRTDKDALMRQFEPGNSQRVTRLGEILRKTKVDELPELFNVLFGHMSIVGPRPEVEKYVLVYPDEFSSILKVRPGLSDYASIKYRNEEESLKKAADPERHYVEEILPDKIRLAKMYSERVSFKTDMSIIAKTIKSIFENKGCSKPFRRPMAKPPL
jgi:lipopolysaccharide/colanic/teichoic acid biosynthesis glycosyltransferase